MGIINDTLTRLFRPHEYYADLVGPSTRDIHQELEVKSFTPAHIDSASRMGRPLWSEWDTQLAIDDGMKAATWVFVCIDKIARSIGSVPFVLEQRGGGDADEWTPASNHPLQRLLNSPNEKMTRSEVMYRATAHLYLGGNSIFTKIRAVGKPVEIWPHNPAGVKPIPSREDFIGGYEFGSGGNRRREDALNVVHIQFPDPANPYWGLSPLKAGSKTIDIEVEARRWQQATLQNAAIPSGIVSLDQKVTETQYDQMRQQLQSSMAGATNARNVGLLTGNAKWLAMNLTPQELDFIESRKLSREEICSLFQVPPPVVGIYENATLANVETAREIFWVDTVIPLLDTFADSFTIGLAAEWGEQFRVRYDVSGVQALWPLFARRLEMATTLFGLGYNANEVNARLQLGMNQQLFAPSLVPSNMVPTDMMMPENG